MPGNVSTVYRIDIVKNGQRWIDTVGVTATPDTIATRAVACLSDAVVETRPRPGDCSVAEVFDHQNRFILRAELSISDDASRP
ncbi:hypothetical protein [Brevundimonas variabilis]|uniref:Uncharacterized protein n=1 Tax=Brevundimonas variabilis TaxID=74312 RepID=A0A7W9FEV9_9CAUL|nr:hypothetical protein [Brevundimonas variabilis]MBB5746695.1 hypothetical protein [Brevundimonas variabilis]